MMLKGVRAAASRANALPSSRGSDFVGSQVFKRDGAAMGLPPRSHWIATAMVKKRVVVETTSWQDRRITLTKEHLFLSRTEGREVAESIPLTEISAVEFVRGPSADEQEEEKGLPRRLKRSDSNKSTQLKKARSLRPTSGRLSINPVAEEEMFLFEIRTKFEGMMNGRTYCVRFSSKAECENWKGFIEKAIKDLLEVRPPSWSERLSQFQAKGARVYTANATQALIAFFIVGNFVSSIIEAELNPPIGTSTHDVLQTIDYCFTGLFTIELAINMFVNWWRPFVQDGWNLFDFVVVTVSLVTAPFSSVPGFTVLRFLRVFRVLRLFRRLAVLHVLIRALSASIIPVIHAFLILLIVTCLYSIIAVVLFAESSPDKFGSFSSSLFTMFQVCTGDGWATTIARPMLDEKGESAIKVGAFFVSYILVGGTFLINIVVAVLLDEFISSVEESRSIPLEATRREHEAEFLKSESPLDPLVATLTGFSSSDDLDQQIQQIYQMLDTDKAGLSAEDGLSYEQLRQGLHRLHFDPRIHLSPDDFEEITHNQALCNALGEVDQASFGKIMRMQLFRFTQKFLSLKMQDASDDQFSLLVAIKQLLLLSGSPPPPPHHDDTPPSPKQPLRNLEIMFSHIVDRLTGIERALGLDSRPNSVHTPSHDPLSASAEDSGETSDVGHPQHSTSPYLSSPTANVLARHPSPVATSPTSNHTSPVGSRRRLPSLEMIAELRGDGSHEGTEPSPNEPPPDPWGDVRENGGAEKRGKGRVTIQIDEADGNGDRSGTYDDAEDDDEDEEEEEDQDEERANQARGQVVTVDVEAARRQVKAPRRYLAPSPPPVQDVALSLDGSWQGGYGPSPQATQDRRNHSHASSSEETEDGAVPPLNGRRDSEDRGRRHADGSYVLDTRPWTDDHSDGQHSNAPAKPLPLVPASSPLLPPRPSTARRRAGPGWSEAGGDRGPDSTTLNRLRPQPVLTSFTPGPRLAGAQAEAELVLVAKGEGGTRVISDAAKWVSHV